MRKILLSLFVILGLVVSAMSPVAISGSVLAKTKGEQCTCADGSAGVVVVDTAILNGCDCSGNGGSDSVLNILDLVVNIMSIGIGILGVIGISIVGIQYLTAGGNEEKTRKAKRRMFEIVIGLVVYVLIYAILQFLMPGMN